MFASVCEKENREENFIIDKYVNNKNFRLENSHSILATHIAILFIRCEAKIGKISMICDY
jgi:hypothetical protein